MVTIEIEAPFDLRVRKHPDVVRLVGDGYRVVRCTTMRAVRPGELVWTVTLQKDGEAKKE